MSQITEFPEPTSVTRLYGRLIARPYAAFVGLLLITAFALWQAQKVEIAVDLTGLIGPETESAQAMRLYETRFNPLRAEEVLLVRAPTLGDAATLAAFEDFVLELQFVDGVEQVISIAGLPAPGRSGAWLSGPELADLSAAERLIRMRTENPLAAQLVSSDLTAAVVVVVPAAGAGGDAFGGRLREVAASATGFSIDLVGLQEVQRAVAAELVHDIRFLIPAAMGICLFLTLLLFRSARAMVAIALPSIVGLVWFFGWLGATGQALDPVMGALPVLLIVLAFSDSIHIYHAALAAVAAPGASADRPRRVATAVVQTMPAAVLTSVTTLVAFASLSLTDSPSLNAMSQAGMGGVILSLLAVLTLTPVLMAVLGVPRPGGHPPHLFAIVLPPALALARRPRLVTVLALAVLSAAWVLQQQSSVGFRYVDNLPRGAAVSEALAEMEALGLGSDRMLVVVEADPADPLDRVARAASAVWGETGGDWVRGPGGETMLPRMASRDGTAHALPVTLPISAANVRADLALTELQGRIAAAGLTGHTHIIGPGHALLTEGPQLVQNLRWGLYSTILAITVMVALVYRSIRLALVALLVNLIPILGVEGWLVLIGRELTIMNVIALTIAFGIAVDDTLHFLNRFRLAPAGPVADRVRTALIEAGPPITATTVILVSGVLVTLMSALPGLAVYGGLIVLAVSVALLADLFLLPGLIRWSLR